MTLSDNNVRKLFVGLEQQVPLLDGRTHRYVNLDNAATTPPFRAVVDHINQCVSWYSSVHRGTGFKSLVSTYIYDRCRERIGAFVGLDPSYHVLIFCVNTTDAINRLCCHLNLEEDEVVLSTVMEHHSNMLPWRFKTHVDYVRAENPSGILDINDLEEKLHHYDGKVRIVAVTGASNITGFIPPLKQIARLTHQHGAQLLVDASQLIAHRSVKMGDADDPERIDFLTFSGHKMYAPFGSGGLIGPRAFFEEGRPEILGGGAVELVSLCDIEWTKVPEKEEAGTPNLIGVCAMAKAIEVLEQIGMEEVADHEWKLTCKCIDQLSRIKGINTFGIANPPDRDRRLGVISFQSDKYHHALLAAILGYEWGIGVRNGCFCAHPYVEHLLGIKENEVKQYFENVKKGDVSSLPGFVRISFALYNIEEEIEYLTEALTSIINNGPEKTYRLNQQTGEYFPEGFSYDFESLIK